MTGMYRWMLVAAAVLRDRDSDAGRERPAAER